MADFNGKEPGFCRGCQKVIKPYARTWRAALNNEAACSTACASMIDIATEDMNHYKKFIGQVLINTKGKAGIVTSVRPHKTKLSHALFGYGVDGKKWTAQNSFSVICKEDSEALKVAFMPPMPDMPPMPAFDTSEMEAAIDRMGQKVEGIFTTVETKIGSIFGDSLVDIFETDGEGKRKKKK